MSATDRVIALAGMAQAAALVQSIADTGVIDTVRMRPLLDSLLNEDAGSAADLYGGLSALDFGLDQLIRQLTKQKRPADLAILRYLVSLLHLERKLATRPAMMAYIGQEMEQIRKQVAYFGSVTQPQVVAHFADVYVNTISQIPPRIQVLGAPGMLQNTENVHAIRALLLTGIRAALLWRQKGGRRWQLVFQTRRLLQTAQALSAENAQT